MDFSFSTMKNRKKGEKKSWSERISWSHLDKHSITGCRCQHKRAWSAKAPTHTHALTHEQTHKTTELLEAPADLVANPAAGQIEDEEETH